MQKLLNETSGVIELWYSSSNHQPVDIIDMAKKLSGSLHFLSKERAHYHTLYENIVYQKCKDMAVNRAENEANIKVPELYMLRQFITSAYKVLEIMRSELSYLKQEMNTLNLDGIS